MSITVENDKLLVERRRLLQQLNEEEHNKKDSNLTATLSKCRYSTYTTNTELRDESTRYVQEIAKVMGSLTKMFVLISRVDFLEMENKKLGNKILHMSKQLAVLERSLQNMQSLHLAEELKKISNPTQVFTSLLVPTSK